MAAERMVDVFVITGRAPKATPGETGGGYSDLGKFFRATDADGAAEAFRRGWADVKVEHRQEAASAQHPAHAALFAGSKR